MCRSCRRRGEADASPYGEAPKSNAPPGQPPDDGASRFAARDAGITDFVFVVGYGEREIRRHFGDGSEFGIHIRYAPQRQQRGTADALRSARDLVSRDRFFS